MAQITLGALDIKVASVRWSAEEVGDVDPAFSGKGRSDIRAHHRVGRVTTPPIPTADMETLRTALLAAQPGSYSGDQIGTASNFHTRDIQWDPLTADEWVVSFTIRETNGF